MAEEEKDDRGGCRVERLNRGFLPVCNKIAYESSLHLMTRTRTPKRPGCLPVATMDGGQKQRRPSKPVPQLLAAAVSLMFPVFWLNVPHVRFIELESYFC